MAECLDALNDGKLGALGDILMQRFKALEVATKDGHWDVARQLEVVPCTDVGLAEQSEVRDAVAGCLLHQQLQDRRQRGGRSPKRP